MVFITAMKMINVFHNCYGDEELFTLLLWRRGMVYTTAMETRNCFDYSMETRKFFTTAMETRNGFQYSMETRNFFHYCYGDDGWFKILLWRQGMVLPTSMETKNGFHYCYGNK